MPQIMMPKKENPISKLLTAGGMIAGGIMGAEGGPASAAQGAALGASLGSTVSGFMAPQDQGQQGIQTSAVSRRLSGQMPQLPDQQAAINNARIALMDQPQELQQQYMPMLTAAALKLRRDQGVA